MCGLVRLEVLFKSMLTFIVLCFCETGDVTQWLT